MKSWFSQTKNLCYQKAKIFYAFYYCLFELTRLATQAVKSGVKIAVTMTDAVICVVATASTDLKDVSTADKAVGVAIALAAVLEIAAPAIPEPPVPLSAKIAKKPPTKVVITPNKIPGKPPCTICTKLILAPKQKPTIMMMAVTPFDRAFFM